MNPISSRLLNQQLVKPKYSDPADVVSHFGIFQAQEYRLMRWGIAMRTTIPSSSAFKLAYDSGKIIRAHLFRGTWQLVAGDDYYWMLNLCMSKAQSVIKGWMHANKIDIPESEQQYIGEILCRCASEMGSATYEDFEQDLKERDIVMDSHRLSYHIRFAELRGQLCSGDLLPMKATYSVPERKIQNKIMLDRDESLSRLARKYFQSHSPATFEDFLWWSGLNVSDCKKGIAILGNELNLVHWNGMEFYFHESCTISNGTFKEINLIPQYDEYLIGYKSRHIVLNPEHSHYAHNNSGNFNPVVAIGGRIVANWTPFAKGDPSITSFDESISLPDCSSAWDRYQLFRNS